MAAASTARQRRKASALLLLFLFLAAVVGRAPAFLLLPPTPRARHRHRHGILAASAASPHHRQQDQQQQQPKPAFTVTRTHPPQEDKGAGEAGAAPVPPVLTVALADGRRFALVDRCPPTNHSLLAARVDPLVLALQDPVFGTRFDLRTGRVRGAWCPDAPWWVRWALPPAGLTVVEVEAGLGVDVVEGAGGDGAGE